MSKIFNNAKLKFPTSIWSYNLTVASSQVAPLKAYVNLHFSTELKWLNTEDAEYTNLYSTVFPVRFV